MDLSDVVGISWALFDQYAAACAAPAAAASAAAADARRRDDAGGEKGSAHVCGHGCPHVCADDSGSFVCRLTGVVFGHQVMNGPLDSRPWVAPSYFPGKRKRSAPKVLQSEDVYSACAQTVHKLLDFSERAAADEERLMKTLKMAVRRAPQLRESTPCAMQLLNALFAGVEKGGSVLVKRSVAEAQLDALAAMLTQLYSTLISPYTREKTRRPTPAYYAVAMCYLLSTRALGARLHVPMLAAFLPEEKSLKRLNFSVTRMTAAKRYTLDAVRHYVCTR